MHVSDPFFDCDSEIDRAFADGLTAERGIRSCNCIL